VEAATTTGDATEVDGRITLVLALFLERLPAQWKGVGRQTAMLQGNMKSSNIIPKDEQTGMSEKKSSDILVVNALLQQNTSQNRHNSSREN